MNIFIEILCILLRTEIWVIFKYHHLPFNFTLKAYSAATNGLGNGVIKKGVATCHIAIVDDEFAARICCK